MSEKETGTRPTLEETRSRAKSAPPWAKDLVIYELNPRGFTSPAGAGDGSGSGTFHSLQEKLRYLQDLGVNAIWMAGHHVATKHFYGVWSVYAAFAPDEIDPTLGSREDLKLLVSAAHERGIRIFLDVIAHGVLHESPLVAEHPDWFNASSWAMADFDYSNEEFRRWWCDLWVNYVVEFGIDGFRIDVNMGDPTIWDEIVRETQALGKQIVVFPEIERYHFSQQDHAAIPTDVYRQIHIADLAGEDRGLSVAQVSCHDYGWEGLPGNHYAARGSRARLAHGSLLSPRIPLFFSGEEFDATPTPLPDLTQGLYGTGGPGGWLYGNQLDWSQLSQTRNEQMHRDVRQMLQLRRQYSHLVNGDSTTVRIAQLHYDGATPFVPYAMANPGVEAFVVVANPSTDAIRTVVRIPKEKLGFDQSTSLELVDLVSGERLDADGDRVTVEVAADYTSGGGYRAFLLAPTSSR